MVKEDNKHVVSFSPLVPDPHEFLLLTETYTYDKVSKKLSSTALNAWSGSYT